MAALSTATDMERVAMRRRLQIVGEPQSRARSFASIEDAVGAIRAGQMAIVVDDEDRENEGDLTIAAEKITPQAINFMAQYGRGLICLAMTSEHLDALEIPLMVPHNSSRFETAFCVSIDAKEGTTTGISAADRAATVLAAINPATKPSDLTRPGHIFPLRAKSAGVLARAGQTEAAVDLARLAGLHPSGVICEIMNKDGIMARVPQLRRFARRHDIPLVATADLIAYRMRTESVVRRVASTRLPTEYGEFRLHAFENQIDKQTHVALVRGEVGNGLDVLVRVHSQCLTGDVLRSARCDCGAQLDKALRRIATEGRGVLLYLNQEGRGIGLANKMRANPARTGRPLHAPVKQQSPQARRHRGLRTIGYEMAASRDSCVSFDTALFDNKTRQARTRFDRTLTPRS